MVDIGHVEGFKLGLGTTGDHSGECGRRVEADFRAQCQAFWLSVRVAGNGNLAYTYPLF